MAINDHNLNLSEQEYRDLEIPSYSMLSSIDKQGVDVIGGVKSSLNLKFGSLVDMMCFEPHRVEDNFYKGNSVKNPTPNVKYICDYILQNVVGEEEKKGSTDSIMGRKRRKRKFSTKISDYKVHVITAANDLKIYKTYSDERVVDTVFKQGKEYFADKVKSKGKVLIKPEMWNHALQTANTLMSHPFTAKYFAKGVPGVEIIYQYKFDTIVKGHRCKGMLDCLVVNHKAKVILPVDLKTGEYPCKDFPMLYTSHRYYIQGALYREALKSIVDSDFDLTDYVVAPFEFIYISKLNPNKPLRFLVDEEMHDLSMKGFTDKYGYTYKGVIPLLEDYYYSVNNDKCEYNEEEMSTKGVVNIDLKTIIG